MPDSFPKLSPALEAVLAKGVLDRLPVTLGAYIGDQLRAWPTLFPPERSYFERMFTLFDKAGDETTQLFEPLRAVEIKMGVTPRTWPKGQFTLDQVDFLNRNAHYPEWRSTVAAIFARVDPILDAQISQRGWPRVSIVIAPAQLPVGPDRLWLRLDSRKLGHRIMLDPPEDVSTFVPTLVHEIPARYAQAKKRPYDTWIIESANLVSANVPETDSIVRLSYDALEPYRRRLMTEVDRIVHDEKIPGPKQLGSRLKELKINPSESKLASDPALAEFVRATLLAGNGTLLLNNTFVEWASVQAVRRARPSVLISAFGIRNKVKPFSGLLIYSDQEKTNPIPTQVDTLGSYVDLEVFYQYIFQEFEKYPEYRRNTAFLFVAEGMDQLYVIAPSDFPLKPTATPLKLEAIRKTLEDWLAI